MNTYCDFILNIIAATKQGKTFHADVDHFKLLHVLC